MIHILLSYQGKQFKGILDFGYCIIYSFQIVHAKISLLLLWN